MQDINSKRVLYPERIENKNRAPTNEEIEFGVTFLKSLSNIFKPTVLAGIGKAGVKAAKHAFPDTEVKYIRHPSFGGKQKFIKGMDRII